MIFDEDLLYSRDQTGNSDIVAAPSSGIGLSDGGASGGGPSGGMAAPELSTGQRIGKTLYNFGAGMEGKPSFDENKQAVEMKKKHAALEEIKGLTTALEHGITMIQGVEGPERDTFVESYAKRLDGIQEGTGDTFRALSKKPDLLTKFKDYAQYMPEPMQALMKTDPKKFIAFAGTAEGQKVLADSKDRFDMRLATKKVQTTLAGLQQFVPADKLKSIMADGVVTATDVMGVQQYLPDAMKLSPSENEAIQRNDKVFWGGLGVLHGTAEQGVMSERAKRTDKGAPPPTKDVDGKTYQWDPDKKLTTARLGADQRYALLGNAASSADGTRRVQDIELKLSDDFRNETKKFKELRAQFESTTDYMANRGTDKTSAGDAALMFAYAKIRDPNDRLAVSETRDLAKLGNIFQRIGASVESVLDKGQVLPDKVAAEMFTEIRRRFTDLNRAQASVETDYTKRAKDYGGEPTRVVRSLALPDDVVNPKKPKGVDQDFADAAAVKSAFDSGKITREQAKTALKKFGFQ